MRIVVALGGNALLKRGEPVSPDAQQRNVQAACAQLAKVALGNELLIVHGNGPQVGFLALQGESLPESSRFPLDVIDAESEGMIGYLIEQELRNALPVERACATLLTMVEVDPRDVAFGRPDKPIGAVYAAHEVDALRWDKGWAMAPDGQGYRRVVPSPKPVSLLQMQPLRWLLERGAIVICAGGGGIPVVRDAENRIRGVEAVVDKDRSAALLAREIEADLFVIATDVDGVYENWGTRDARRLGDVNPHELEALTFATGSMAPKVQAASEFARLSGRRAVIGALDDIEAMIAGVAGTSIRGRAA